MSDNAANREREAADQGGLIFPSERKTDREVENLDLPRPLEEHRKSKETNAGLLSIGLFILFSIEVVTYIASAYTSANFDNIKQVYQVVFPVTAGFFGAAVTYYLKS